MIDIIWSATQTIKGISAENDFAASVTPLLIPNAGGMTSATVKDISYDKSVAASTSQGATVTVTPTGITAAISTDTPSVCSVAGGVVTPITTGDAGILVTTPLGTRRYVQPVSLTAGASSKTTTGYTAGSLAKHVADAIATMISGKSAGAASKELFSAADYSLTAPSATRNAGLFSGSLDLSAICFARDLDPTAWQYYNFPVVLIASQVVVFAWHARVGNGTKITFMRPNGTFQLVTVSGEPVQVSGLDIGIAKLSAAITGITPMATLGAGYENKLPCMCAAPEQPITGAGVQVPVLFKGGRLGDYSFANRLDILPLNTMYQNNMANYPSFYGSFLLPYQYWTDAIVGGDSSGVTMLPINGSPVLLGMQSTNTGASSIPYLRTAINAAMTSLMGGSTNMAVADLTAFNTY